MAVLRGTLNAADLIKFAYAIQQTQMATVPGGFPPNPAESIVEVSFDTDTKTMNVGLYTGAVGTTLVINMSEE